MPKKSDARLTERFYFFIVLNILIEYNLDLHGGLLDLSLLKLGDLSSGLGAQRATAPVLSDLIEPLVVVGLDSLDQLVQGAAVIRLNLQKDNHSPF